MGCFVEGGFGLGFIMLWVEFGEGLGLGFNMVLGEGSGFGEGFGRGVSFRGGFGVDIFTEVVDSGFLLERSFG